MNDLLFVAGVGVLGSLVVKNLWDERRINWLYDRQTQLEMRRGHSASNYGIEHLFSRLQPSIDPKRWTACVFYENIVKANTDVQDVRNVSRHQSGVEARTKSGRITGQAMGPRHAIYDPRENI